MKEGEVKPQKGTLDVDFELWMGIKKEENISKAKQMNKIMKDAKL